MLTIKLRTEKDGSHLVNTVFIGQKDQTLQNAGTLTFPADGVEWTLFGAILMLGADVVKQTRARQGVESDVEVILEGWNGDESDGLTQR